MRLACWFWRLAKTILQSWMISRLDRKVRPDETSAPTRETRAPPLKFSRANFLTDKIDIINLAG